MPPEQGALAIQSAIADSIKDNDLQEGLFDYDREEIIELVGEGLPVEKLRSVVEEIISGKGMVDTECQ